MGSLTNRLRDIIKELLAFDAPITSEYISKMVGVTSRTIRNDIFILNTELNKIGMKIDAQRGVGYFLEPKPDQKMKDLIEDLFQVNETPGNPEMPVMPEERVFYILKRIIMADDFITIEQIANELFVSKSTIDNDLKEVEKLLGKFEVFLYKKPNFGIKAIGDEMKIRFCLSDCLLNLKTEQSPADPSFVEGTEVARIRVITLEHIQQLPINIAKMPIDNLVMHIAIGIQRIKKGKNIELSSLDFKDIGTQKEYEIAGNIVSALEKEFSIKIHEQEIAYITLHLMGAKQFQDGGVDENNFIELIGRDIYRLVVGMLSAIKRQYDMDLLDDQELIYGLGLHLRSAINRMKYKMNLRNPILKEIKANYPLAFELSIVASNIIWDEKQIKINEDEMGYIAVHLAASIERMKNKKKRELWRVAIVCASGMGTAKLLAARIESNFPRVDIVGTYPSYYINEIEKGSVDLILSTIPIEKEGPIPILHINALLVEKDVNKINNYISQSGDQNEKEKSFESLRELFNKDIFFPELQQREPMEIINSMAANLTSKGYVDEAYLHSVIEREQLSPTSIGNLTAIPHPVKPNALNSCIAIGILKKPVVWGESTVQLVLMLALNENDKDKFSNLFTKLWKLVEDKKLVAELCKNADFSEIVAKLENIR